MKPSHTNLAFIRAKKGKSEALGKALLALVPQSRRDPTCLAYDLHRSIDDPDLWFVYEIWKSAEALTAHLDSAFMKNFAAQSRDILDGDLDLRAFLPISTHLNP